MALLDLLLGGLGLLLALALPGFFLLRAVAPHRRDPVLTAVVAVVGSVAVTVLVGASLGFAGLFRREMLLVSLGAATALLASLAYARGGLRRAGTHAAPRPEAAAWARAARSRERLDAARRRNDVRGAEAAEADARAAESELDALRNGP